MPDSSPTSDQTSNQSAAPATGAPAAAAPAAAASAPASTAVPAASDTSASSPAAAAPAIAPAQPPDKPAAGAVPPASADAPKPGEAPAAAAPPPPAAPVVPETYVLPQLEGVQIDPAVLPVMAPAFKAAGLTQAQVDQVAKTFLEFQQKAPARMLATDLEVTMKDPSLGGLNWGRTQSYVNDALVAFTTPEFRGQLERWGVANNLEFVRVFESIGRAMRGDTIPRGNPTTAEESVADRIYGRAKKVNSGG